MLTLGRCFWDWTVTRWWWLLPGVASLVCLLLWYGLSLYQTPAWPRLRVMTYNIGGLFANRAQLLALISANQPDLVMLQEVHLRQVRWFARHLQLPYWRFAQYQSSQGGVAMLSRWPLGAAQVLTFHHGRQGKVALAAPVFGSAAPLWACSVHLEAPHLYEFGASVWQRGAFLWSEVFASTPRYQQVQELRAWLRQLPADAWIIGGDFNSVPFSRADRYLSEDFDDVLLQRPWRYLTGTYWQLKNAPVKPRIDFVYYSPRLRVVEAQVLQHKVSDHFPILAIFATPGLAQPEVLPEHSTNAPAAPATALLPPPLPSAPGDSTSEVAHMAQ
jgi:endonuclease/exonuclease/phosphatase (EEP) superfamily protein YafD